MYHTLITPSPPLPPLPPFAEPYPPPPPPPPGKPPAPPLPPLPPLLEPAAPPPDPEHPIADAVFDMAKKVPVAPEDPFAPAAPPTLEAAPLPPVADNDPFTELPPAEPDPLVSFSPEPPPAGAPLVVDEPAEGVAWAFAPAPPCTLINEVNGVDIVAADPAAPPVLPLGAAPPGIDI